MPRAGPSNATKKPSPVVSISIPGTVRADGVRPRGALRAARPTDGRQRRRRARRADNVREEDRCEDPVRLGAVPGSRHELLDLVKEPSVSPRPTDDRHLESTKRARGCAPPGTARIRRARSDRQSDAAPASRHGSPAGCRVCRGRDRAGRGSSPSQGLAAARSTTPGLTGARDGRDARRPRGQPGSLTPTIGVRLASPAPRGSTPNGKSGERTTRGHAP